MKKKQLPLFFAAPLPVAKLFSKPAKPTGNGN